MGTFLSQRVYSLENKQEMNDMMLDYKCIRRQPQWIAGDTILRWLQQQPLVAVYCYYCWLAESIPLTLFYYCDYKLYITCHLCQQLFVKYVRKGQIWLICFLYEM